MNSGRKLLWSESRLH